ncbi:hypothetical protein Ddye_025956 [Dipteronia dyeriana]|uniref:Calmodulin-binding protein n=1 Tax=Dipteronia dyeriana TaxID=168575 RepID=A0AAD9WP11_9ROSI|nr:hypothetical protein Ddye_025956 [Dipteronia dyeriana]
MDVVTRKLMKDTVSVVRKEVRAEMKREMKGALNRVWERVWERMKPVMEEETKKEMKRTMKSGMRVWKQEMERLAMEPVKMQPANERAKKKRAMESTFSTQDVPPERNFNQRTSLDHQIKKSEQVEFQLQFINNKLPDEIYTNDEIKHDSDGSVEIKLIDTISRETVELDPHSSIVIEIVVLDGDFDSDGHENWTEEQFNAKILTKRQLVNGTVRLLVKGKQHITLTDGVGTIQELRFIENSSWLLPCKKYRLGARVLQSNSNRGQVRIKEAITEPFRVLDYRGRKYKKHYLPSLDDEVWHLKRIRKDCKFHIRLIDNNIHTIRDFKQAYKTNAGELKEILKDCSESNWEKIVKHADSVVDDEKLNASSQGKHDFRFENLPGQNSSQGSSELPLFPMTVFSTQPWTAPTYFQRTRPECFGS